uniref:Uncharacterized protein n=1 Tax=Anguilla anguilla TaxID=7936 RepID=A0A0E9UQK4_ANGAN
MSNPRFIPNMAFLRRSRQKLSMERRRPVYFLLHSA